MNKFTKHRKCHTGHSSKDKKNNNGSHTLICWWWHVLHSHGEGLKNLHGKLKCAIFQNGIQTKLKGQTIPNKVKVEITDEGKKDS